jgi:hypothetical protein
MAPQANFIEKALIWAKVEKQFHSLPALFSLLVLENLDF